MKKFTLSLLLVCFVSTNGLSWGNGGKSTSASNPKFAMHDWIALRAFEMAKVDANLSWITDNLDMFLYGTEAPDKGVLPSVVSSLHPGTGYSDTGACHCVLFKTATVVKKDRAAMRVQQEFDKAKAALAANKPKLAAFYAGAMAHYLGDLSQFMHMMGEGSRWGKEVQAIHHAYEQVVDDEVDVANRTSPFESFVHEKAVAGTSAKAVAMTVARFTDRGNGTVNTAGHMYTVWKNLRTQHNASETSNWTANFRDQTGKNVNESINGIAKLLVLLSQ